MIKGALSGHSPWMQFLMLVFLVFLGMIVFTIIGLMFIPVIYPVSFSEVFNMLQAGQPLGPELLIFLQGLSSIGTFLIPAMVAAYLFSYSGADYLRLTTFPRRWIAVALLLIVLTLSGNSVSDLLYRLSKAMPWPESLNALKDFIDDSELSMNEQIRIFLKMNSSFEFVQIFFIMAILPAVCEEALFRGALQPVMKKLSGGLHSGVLITSILFALIHLQFYTFLPILALGLVLGYIKEWSNSLWVPMIVHLINNGSIVVAVYFFDVDYQSMNEVSAGWNLQYTIPGVVVFIVTLYLLQRIFRSEKKELLPDGR